VIIQRWEAKRKKDAQRLERQALKKDKKRIKAIERDLNRSEKQMKKKMKGPKKKGAKKKKGSLRKGS